VLLPGEIEEIGLGSGSSIAAKCRKGQGRLRPDRSRSFRKAKAPPGESGAFLRKREIAGGGGGDLLQRCVGRSRKRVQKQQRRLSGVCSLGGAAVKLDRLFPSNGRSAQPGKGSTARSSLAEYFRQTGNRRQPADKIAVRLCGPAAPARPAPRRRSRLADPR
jgi:hypothetical protein